MVRVGLGKIMKRTMLTSLILLLFLSSTYAQVAASDAKAVAQSIVDLVSTTTWPSGAGPGEGAVKVCIVGDSPVKASLEELASSSSKSLEISQAALGDDLSAYHVVYNPSGEIASLAKVLKGVGGAKVLTVSTGKDFARYGVMVNLSKDGSKFKYEINTMVVDGAGLKIDDKILSSATKI